MKPSRSCLPFRGAESTEKCTEDCAICREEKVRKKYGKPCRISADFRGREKAVLIGKSSPGMSAKMPVLSIDMVGVVGSSPIAPTNTQASKSRTRRNRPVLFAVRGTAPVRRAQEEAGMVKRIVWTLAVVVLVLAAYLVLWPVPIRAVSWKAPPAPGYAAPHAANDKLAGLTLI